LVVGTRARGKIKIGLPQALVIFNEIQLLTIKQQPGENLHGKVYGRVPDRFSLTVHEWVIKRRERVNNTRLA